MKNNCKHLISDMSQYCEGKKPKLDFIDLILMRLNRKKMQNNDEKVFNKHFNKLKNEQIKNR